ncbi:ATP-binding cassette domain-containing protein [Sphingobium sp. YR768]|jgi:molybdate transport system ATP-binding protein|uniref:ATP-binding cassette domain-containing protein n=1 Tax=Sphingobium sp. YR768 TaxID=1884365 RepID=UPI0008C97CE4|nr:ATP-binding cassette domain-containing protein [Sphingobium sp. YR768]SEQ94241.1 molybdate transport system ATP-binding protein [Sphingobium sp. YR768]
MSFDIDVRRRIGDRDIALQIRTGPGLIALVGPSGAGKTSLLNMIAGLLRPDAGHIAVGGHILFDSAAGIDLPTARRQTGYVFQDMRLFPHMRVRTNLLYGQRHADSIDLDERLGFLGIGHLLRRLPATLSGGEAKRVAIGRALLSDPAFLLMDEPLSSLDDARREEIMAAIERLRDQFGLPILYVTHSRAEAERLASETIYLNPTRD